MMRNRWGVEVKKGQYAWAHAPRGGMIEGRIRKIEGRGSDAFVTFESGQTASLDDVVQVLGEMKRGPGGVVKQNPLLRVKVGSPSQRPHRTDDGGESNAPTGRLKARRRKTVKAPRGVYANPTPYRNEAKSTRVDDPAWIGYAVHRPTSPNSAYAVFKTKVEAIEYAKQLATQKKTAMGVTRIRYNVAQS